MARLFAAAYVEGDASSVMLWDVETGKPRPDVPLKLKKGHVQCVAFSDVDSTLAVAHDGGVLLWEMGSGKDLLEASLPERKGSVRSVAFSLDGRNIAAGYDDRLYVWERAKPTVVSKKPVVITEGFFVLTTEFSRDGKFVSRADL